MLNLKGMIKEEVEMDQGKKRMKIQKYFIFFGAIHQRYKVNLTVEFFVLYRLVSCPFSSYLVVFSTSQQNILSTKFIVLLQT